MPSDFQFIQTVLSVVKKGSSRPVVAVDSTGKTVFVKLNGGLSSPTAAISDWVARRIALEIGLPVVNPTLIQIDDRADTTLVDVEVRDLLRKSHGLNSCTPYFQNVIDLHLPSDLLSAPVQERLFIFDLFLLNVDRTFSNSNLIHVDSSIYSIDYEASFMIMGALNGKRYHEKESVHTALRQNPLYHPRITQESIIHELEQIRKVEVRNILSSLPDSWLVAFDSNADLVREMIMKSFTEQLNNKEQYLKLHTQLEHIPFISEAERKRKNLENRNIFTSKYKL